MFTITNFSDVVAVAKTFGVPALRYAMDNSTISSETTQRICECLAWAARETITIADVNDGNVQYCITAAFYAEKVGNEYITNLDDITIVRTGFGSFTLPVSEAVKRKEITMDSLRYILSEIDLRNKAAAALGI